MDFELDTGSDRQERPRIRPGRDKRRKDILSAQARKRQWDGHATAPRTRAGRLLSDLENLAALEYRLRAELAAERFDVLPHRRNEPVSSFRYRPRTYNRPRLVASCPAAE